MLAKWNPFRGGSLARSPSPVADFDTLFQEAENLFQGSLFRDVPSTWALNAPLASVAAADVVETDDEVHVTMDLPGVDPKALDVKLEGDTLTIQAERKLEPAKNVRSVLRSERTAGMVARSFVLPATVDPSTCRARLEHGVLTVTIGKRAESKPRSIEVKVEAA